MAVTPHESANEYFSVRSILIAFSLCASISTVLASPPTSIHIANSSDQALSIWINGDPHELPVDGGIVFPCFDNERHTVQTALELKQVTCGEFVEVGR